MVHRTFHQTMEHQCRHQCFHNLFTSLLSHQWYLVWIATHPSLCPPSIIFQARHLRDLTIVWTAIRCLKWLKFPLRKDLLFSRLTTFNDKDESCHAWKASFKGIMEDLQVSDAEQIDLLVKWLGTESSSHAVSIRSSNAGNPKRGLQRLWERLDERYVYGSPEMVDASLKTKLANFPKISNKDTKRLYELQYILLGYFDSSSGIRPIVAKLPYTLQEKWTSRASS